MARPALGPRLYLRRRRSSAIWFIRHGDKMISTRAAEADLAAAKRVLRRYVLSMPWDERPERVEFAKQGRKPESLPLVYFITCDAPDFPIKIGTTTNLEKRVAAIQGVQPYPVKVLATAPGDSALERRLHQIFGPYRLRGEWFNRSNALMTIISEIA